MKQRQCCFDVKIFTMHVLAVSLHFVFNVYTVHSGIYFYYFPVHICNIVHMPLQLTKTVSGSRHIEHPWNWDFCRNFSNV